MSRLLKKNHHQKKKFNRRFGEKERKMRLSLTYFLLAIPPLIYQTSSFLVDSEELSLKIRMRVGPDGAETLDDRVQ